MLASIATTLQDTQEYPGTSTPPSGEPRSGTTKRISTSAFSRASKKPYPPVKPPRNFTGPIPITNHSPQPALAGFLLAEPAYFGTDLPDLRLALHRIINNPRTSVEILL